MELAKFWLKARQAGTPVNQKGPTQQASVTLSHTGHCDLPTAAHAQAAHSELLMAGLVGWAIS